MVRRSRSAAVSVRSFFGHSDARALCGCTMPDSSPLTSGYGSVLIAVTPHATTEPHANEPNQAVRQFTLMFAALMTGAQRVISLSIRARNSAGLLPIGSIN